MNNEYFNILIFLKLLLSKIPINIIPKEIKKIDEIARLSIIRPKNKIEIIVVTIGPKPLAIG